MSTLVAVFVYMYVYIHTYIHILTSNAELYAFTRSAHNTCSPSLSGRGFTPVFRHQPIRAPAYPTITSGRSHPHKYHHHEPGVAALHCDSSSSCFMSSSLVFFRGRLADLPNASFSSALRACAASLCATW